MSSKAILFLCLSLAVVLLIASEVAARDSTETSKKVDNAEVVEDAKYQGGGNGGYSGGGGNYPGGGYPGGGHGGGGGNGGYPGGGRGGRGGYCRWGCCGRNYHGPGCRCCSYAGEVVDAEPQQTKPLN